MTQPITNSGEEPRCPECGYTKQDALIHWDHHLCKGKIPGYDKKLSAVIHPDEIKFQGVKRS